MGPEELGKVWRLLSTGKGPVESESEVRFDPAPPKTYVFRCCSMFLIFEYVLISIDFSSKFELIFKKIKPRQNWSRDHFEATQQANFSILKPNFWSGDTAMGMAHWHNPKRVNFFSNILQNHYFVRWNSYFYQHFSGWLFFANFQTRISYFFTMGLSPCTAWVGDRYIGEVISPFRTLPWQKMTAQFQFFQSLPHKKADFVKKSRQNMG